MGLSETAVWLYTVFLAWSLFVPKLIPGLVQVEDGLLMVLFLAVIWRVRSLCSFRYAVVAVVALFTMMGIGLIVSTVLMHHGLQAIVLDIEKETARLIKLLMVICVTHCIVEPLSGPAGLRFGRSVWVFLALHTAIGLAQWNQVGFVLDTTQQWFSSVDDTKWWMMTQEAREAGEFRGSGTVYDANIYGGLSVLMFLLDYLFAQRRSKRISSMVMMSICVMLSQSRTALFAAVASVFFVLRDTKASGRVIVGFALLIVFVAMYHSGETATRLFDTFRTGGIEKLLGNRPQYEAVLATVDAKEVLIGYGLGVNVLGATDSDFVAAFMQVGAVGLALFSVFYWSYIRLALRQRGTLVGVFVVAMISATNGAIFGNEFAPFSICVLIASASRELWFNNISIAWRNRVPRLAGLLERRDAQADTRPLRDSPAEPNQTHLWNRQ